jgi:hypothetical protein
VRQILCCLPVDWSLVPDAESGRSAETADLASFLSFKRNALGLFAGDLLGLGFLPHFASPSSVIRQCILRFATSVTSSTLSGSLGASQNFAQQI